MEIAAVVLFVLLLAFIANRLDRINASLKEQTEQDRQNAQRIVKAVDTLGRQMSDAEAQRIFESTREKTLHR